MQFRMLGPVEALEDGVPVPIGGPRQRALLALLLLRRNETVSADWLVEELWGADPPRTATAALQNKIAQLRKAVGADRVVTRPLGYSLRVEDGQLDLDRFEALVAEAASVEPARRARALREALALWRGPALAGVERERFVELAAARLEEARLAALEQRIEADLELGRHAELVGELTSFVGEHPLRERLQEYLVLALYRSGRQADALAAYHEARRRLADELGLEPTPALRRLEHAILVHDPSVGAPVATVAAAPGAGNGHGDSASLPRPAAPTPESRSLLARHRLVAAAAATVFAAAAGGAVSLALRPATAARAASHSLVALDPESGRILDSFEAGTSPGPIALGEGALWVGDLEDDTLVHVDPATGRVLRTIGLGAVPSEIAVGHGRVWVTSAAEGALVRVNASTDDLEPRIDLGEGGRGATPVAVGPSAVWVGHEDELVLLALDPATNQAVARVEGVSAKSIAATERDVWVLDSASSEVLRLDPESAEVVARLRVGEGAWALAADETGVWVADVHEDAVWWIDPMTESVRRTLPVGEDPRRLWLDDGYVWTANATDGSVSRIDAATGDTETFDLGPSLDGIAPDRDRVWVSAP